MSSAQQNVIEIASKHLGKVGGDGYSDQYDPSLLVKIPRYLNRVDYNIDSNNLPFNGYDVWNAYEISCITDKGLPVVGMVKIIYSSDSIYHVESKSLKLYLNSFNMTKSGLNVEIAIQNIKSRIETDLYLLLETDVIVSFFTNEDYKGTFLSFTDVMSLVDEDSLTINDYALKATQLEKTNSNGKHIDWKSNLLRSNCRVTNQPDWGDIYIHMKSNEIPTPTSFIKYIVSHRSVSHFHEEICEMVYKQLWDEFKPEELMVSCLYTRRGGIDINPIRASKKELIPDWYTSEYFLIQKTLRQ